MRELMKRSTSRLSTSTKGSVTHLGTTPYRFKIDMFISYAEKIKSLSDACITWERRGKVQATNVVKVKDGKAVFRHQMSMECTLFRKSAPNKSKADKAGAPPPEELKFDEKKAKVFLRKGSAQGKAVAKLALNLSDYIKGATSTVFADMKLSDGTLVVTKIEATMIYMDKKKKGSRTGSDFHSEMSDECSVDNDDSFLDDLDDLHNVQRFDDELTEAVVSPVNIAITTPVTASSSGAKRAFENGSTPTNSGTNKRNENASGVSASSGTSESSFVQKRSVCTTKPLKDRSADADLTKDSPTMKSKSKNKDKTTKKEKEAERDVEKLNKSPKNSQDAQVSEEVMEELREWKKNAENLKKENNKLKRAKAAAVEELEALRNELRQYEQKLEDTRTGRSQKELVVDSRMMELKMGMTEKERKISELKAQNEHLIDELEEQHQEIRSLSVKGKEQESLRAMISEMEAEREKMRQEMEAHSVDISKAAKSDEEVEMMRQRICELEISLQREPTFMDVVNELKVVKVSLALANMEKEQAIFELQNERQASRAMG